jgi:lysine 2,3-aminomutase
MLDPSTKALDLDHRTFRSDEFWREVPGWRDVSEAEFTSHLWQSKHSIRKLEQLRQVLEDRISTELISDIAAGLKIAPMNIRITPYVFSLIDWDHPLGDPLRKQFLPVASQMLPDHPYYLADSLYEDVDSPVPMLTHRYPDKVLFLPLTTCPVYCAYCTRSRIIGGSTELVDKETYGPNPENWRPAFDYIQNHKEIEDVVISGGDAFNLTPRYIRLIGENLLSIPHIRRIRYATKGIAILPMKILTDDQWLQALIDVHQMGRQQGKQVVVHTHFSCHREITRWSLEAANKLFSVGITVRNQAVLQEGVNHCMDEMVLLTRKLSYMNIQPYYVYIHDMVPGCEHLRTTIGEGVELEKNVRGTTAGFNTPTFVCDAPGGGGKRHVASFEYYDRENGISAWKSPNVKPGELFLYFDPLHRLAPDAQERWGQSDSRTGMIQEVLRRVDSEMSSHALEKISRRLEGGVLRKGSKS